MGLRNNKKGTGANRLAVSGGRIARLHDAVVRRKRRRTMHIRRSCVLAEWHGVSGASGAEMTSICLLPRRHLALEPSTAVPLPSWPGSRRERAAGPTTN